MSFNKLKNGILQPKRKLKKIKLEFDDSEGEEDNLVSPKNPIDEVEKSNFNEKLPKTIKFKKLSKDKALKIKQEDENEDNELPSISIKKEDDELPGFSIKKEETYSFNKPIKQEANRYDDCNLIKKEENVDSLLPTFGDFVKAHNRSTLQQLAKQEEEQITPATQSSDEEDVDFDRDWYMQDEQVSHGYFNDYDMNEEEEEALETKIETKRIINKKEKIKTNNASEQRWFDDRQAQASGGKHRSLDQDDDLDEVSYDIELLVHRLNPPFLEADTVLSNQVEIVQTIRDKTGDLYKYSKNGSNLVNERRMNKDRKKNAKDAASIKDSTLGKVLGEKKEGQDSKSDKEEDSDDFIKALDKDGDYSKEAIKKQRMNLPAYKVKDELLKIIRENQVIVVIGETGSGKTTQLPQFLCKAGYHKQGLIGITQPRRVATMSVAKRVSEEMGVSLGDEVGFTIRFEDHSNEKTRIKFMTEGILLRETLLNADLDQYSCIIMDEAHERSLNTDILLGLFKSILSRRRDLKLIITSATMNANKFSRFYGNAEQFTIPGRTFPVNIMHSAVPPIDYVENAVKQVLRVHLGQEDGDILVFMTGQEDIEATCEEVEKELLALIKLDDSIKPLQILPIYSTLPADLQARVFRKSKIRKCIVATNIAETSLTVDGVKFVIDTGLMKLKVYNPKIGLDSLQITPISLAQANQRSGRAGRTGPGTCYRLYTLTTAMEEMFPEPIPEIQRTNLSNIILLLKSLNVKDLGKFPFLDRPSIEAINTAQYDLWSIGALNNFGELTKLGQTMSKLPIDPALSKLVILSTLSRFSCSKEMITIVSMLSIPPIFIRPTNDANLMKKSDSIREKFQVAESDHLTLLNIYNQFEKSRKWGARWCQDNFLNFKSLRKAKEIQIQLIQILKGLKLPILSTGIDTDKILECLSSSFYQHAAKFKKYGEYQNLRTGLIMKLHPTSSLYGMGDLPKYVIYHEVMLTGENQYMNYVSYANGEWLNEFGSIFYTKKTKSLTAKENQAIKEKEFDELIKEESSKRSAPKKITEDTSPTNNSLFKKRRFGGRRI